MKSLKIRNTTISDNINDPYIPENVLFGLMDVNFFPLNVFPNIYPPISDATEVEINNNKNAYQMYCQNIMKSK